MALLALPPHDADLDGPEVISTTYIYQRSVEPAGDIYETYLMRRLGFLDEPEDEDDLEKETDEGVNKEKMNEKRKKASKSDAMKNLIFKNHYQALGLEHIYFEATLEDVRKAYKSKVLTHHPDKFEDETYDGIAKQQWLSIQEAYETLVDPEKKKRYDSTMEFDESLPAAKDYDDEDFYTLFGACFARNGIFSEKKPVPTLGDEKTPIGKVIKFYEFWNAFKSWRDFTVEDEYDLEQAENRYERRYMERENKRMKQGKLKIEKVRIKKLVDMARARDPRIIKHEKEENERIEKIREEKRMEKQKKKDDEEKRKADAVAEAKAKVAREQEEVRRREEEGKAAWLQKKSRMDELKSLVSKKVNLPEYGPGFLDFFFEGVQEHEFVSILETLRSDLSQEDMRTKFRDFVSDVKERQSPQSKKKGEEKPKENKLANLSKWTDEEIALLTKGILKYPAGMGGRWDKISDYIGGTKNVHEVTAMAKELSIKNVRGEKNVKETMDEVLKTKQQQLATAGASKAGAQPASVKKPETTTEESQGGQAAAGSANEWSQPQQKALEAALKQFPATMEKKERWTKISEAVGGKTAKECLERVKEIKEKLASKKAE